MVPGILPSQLEIHPWATLTSKYSLTIQSSGPVQLISKDRPKPQNKVQDSEICVLQLYS